MLIPNINIFSFCCCLLPSPPSHPPPPPPFPAKQICMFPLSTHRYSMLEVGWITVILKPAGSTLLQCTFVTNNTVSSQGWNKRLNSYWKGHEDLIQRMFEGVWPLMNPRKPHPSSCMICCRYAPTAWRQSRYTLFKTGKCHMFDYFSCNVWT